MEPDRNGSRRIPDSDLELIVTAAPAIARLLLGGWLRGVEWAASGGVERLLRLLQAIARELPAVPSGGGDDVLDEEEVAELVAAPPTVAERGGEVPDRGTLRERGTELLRLSADVNYEEPAHPAYERILSQVAPDEARILVLLAAAGAQAAVDVRGAKGFSPQTQMIAPGLSMIGPQAGVRHLDRVPAYLNNLYRLGLIWFSRESLPDPLDYQVLEAQPDVIEALRGAGRSKTVRRSIHLTPFGEDFCETCLPDSPGQA